MTDDPAAERVLDSVIRACRATVGYSVVRRYRGEVIFALSGARLEVERVYEAGSVTRLW
jgi:hypothetical protein